jgi:hypothetical protein
VEEEKRLYHRLQTLHEHVVAPNVGQLVQEQRLDLCRPASPTETPRARGSRVAISPPAPARLLDRTGEVPRKLLHLSGQRGPEAVPATPTAPTCWFDAADAHAMPRPPAGQRTRGPRGPMRAQPTAARSAPRTRPFSHSPITNSLVLYYEKVRIFRLSTHYSPACLFIHGSQIFVRVPPSANPNRGIAYEYCPSNVRLVPSGVVGRAAHLQRTDSYRSHT